MAVNVSVLFAVYGIPKRILLEGLECLRRQTYKDAEFLLVNDQSPDDFTAGILDKYAAEDSRFRVITNAENMGLAGVRNLSIEASTGKYYTMFDPDDLIPDNYLEIMCGVMDYYDADMVTCAIREFKDGENVNFQNDIKIDRYLTLPRPLQTRKIFRQKFICRIFKRDVIGDLRFERLLSRGSDLLFIHQYLMRCERTVDIDFAGYFYRIGRIFAADEQKIPARNKNNKPKHFYGTTRIMIDGFANLFESCKTDAERSFAAYMTVRRFMRSAFGFRKLKSEQYDDLRDNLAAHYQETVSSVAEKMYPWFRKKLDKTFLKIEINKSFFFKIQLLRILFELRHLEYHISKTCAKITLNIKHVRG